MFTTGLSQQTQNNLAVLSRIPFVKKYYLAGGTGLSLHCRHRFSQDLDFFSSKPETPLVIASILKDKGKLEIFQNETGSFSGLFNQVKLSFFLYPYKMLNPLLKFKGINIASLEDIAVMKINAISSRGTKRDFIDLYSIIKKGYPFAKLMKMFEVKFSGLHYNRLHIIKSLVYFKDAENEVMPEMIEPLDWRQVKKFFLQEIKNLAV